MFENLRHSTSWLLASVFVLGYCWAYFNINKDQIRRKTPVSLRGFGLFATFNVIGLVTAILNGTPPTITQMATTSILSISTVMVGVYLNHAIRTGKIKTKEQQTSDLIGRINRSIAYCETDIHFHIIQYSSRFEYLTNTPYVEIAQIIEKDHYKALSFLFGKEAPMIKNKLDTLLTDNNTPPSSLRLESSLRENRKIKTVVSFVREDQENGKFLFVFLED